jgi:hypothetical protein
MDFPSFGCHNGKCQSYGIHLFYWREGLIIVNTMNLLKAFGNKPNFVSANLSICCTLGLVDPYASDKFPLRRKGNQIPSLVLDEGVVLLLHGGFPKGTSNNLVIRLWREICLEGNGSVAVSAIGGSKSYRVLLVSDISPTRSPTS